MASTPSTRRQPDGVAAWSLIDRFRQHGCVFAEKRTHWLISTQVSTGVSFTNLCHEAFNMDPDALSAFRLAIVDEVRVADSEDDVENVFAYHVATTPSPSSAPSYAPTREKDKEDRRRLSLVPPCQGGLVEFDVRCRWLAPVDNVNVTRAERWCRRTVRQQLGYALGNGTLATAFETRGNNTALAGAILNVNATLAELHGAFRIGEVLTDAPTPHAWSDNCECVPAAPTKILTLQTAAASPEYGCPRVCTVQTGRVSPPPSPASRR